MLYRVVTLLALAVFGNASTLRGQSHSERWYLQHVSEPGSSLIGPRIVGGTNANAGEFPHQVSLQLDGSHICGGSIIAADWVITAAHCVDFGPSVSRFSVRVGGLYIQGSSNRGSYHDLDSITIHPDYASTDVHDIAVLKLSTPYTGPSSAYIPMANPNEEDEATGKDVVVTGWGATSEGGSGPAGGRLQKVTVQIVSHSDCSSAYTGYGIDRSAEICAAVDGGGKDSCQGDSGGPLIGDDEDGSEKVLIGVVSWGVGCARARYPGVYTRVSSHVAWVNGITGGGGGGGGGGDDDDTGGDDDDTGGDDDDTGDVTETLVFASGKKGTKRLSNAVGEVTAVRIDPGLTARHFESLGSGQAWFVQAQTCGSQTVTEFDTVITASLTNPFTTDVSDAAVFDDNCPGGGNRLASRARVKLTGPDDFAFFRVAGYDSGEYGNFRLKWVRKKKASDWAERSVESVDERKG